MPVPQGRLQKANTKALHDNAVPMHVAEDVQKLIRRMPPKPKDLDNIDYVPLVAAVDGCLSKETHESLRKMDQKRKILLTLARNTSAINTLWKVNHWPRTVLPKLMRKPMIWVLLSTFWLGAALQRYGDFDDSAAQEAEQLMDMGGLGTTVAFMTVFYTGYCYTRSESQFDDIQLIMHSINNACIAARSSFTDSTEIHRFWRYLNLLHAAAYCGITASATDENFFHPILKKYGLEGEGKNKEKEEKIIGNLRRMACECAASFWYGLSTLCRLKRGVAP